MRRYLNALFGLNDERSIWIEQEDLGKEKTITLQNKQYLVKIPAKINKKVILRLRGLGKTKDNKTGDLLLSIWLNKGDDIYKNLWLSETCAQKGAYKNLFVDEKKIAMQIPPNSHDGLIIRLKGLGVMPDFNWRAPLLRRRRGNLLVKLLVYPDSITPQYRSFDTLTTDNMVLEGWVYKKIDEVVHKIGHASFPVNPIQADEVADIFNELGWKGILDFLVVYLNLAHLKIQLKMSDPNSKPGSCQRTVTHPNNTSVVSEYLISINEKFVDNPFSIAAILAHELCHVINSERINDDSRLIGVKLRTEQEELEEERTVDLLVFMLKLGEFQLRVARDKRLTLGYFNQEIFERIQVIVSRKLNGH